MAGFMRSIQTLRIGAGYLVLTVTLCSFLSASGASFVREVSFPGTKLVPEGFGRSIAVSDGGIPLVLDRVHRSSALAILEVPAGDYRLRFNYAADPRRGVLAPSLSVAVVNRQAYVARETWYPETGTLDLPGWHRAEISFSAEAFPGATTANVLVTIDGSGDFGVLSDEDGFVLIDGARLIAADSEDALVLDGFGQRHGAGSEGSAIRFSARSEVRWNARSHASWVRIIGASEGIGAGKIDYRVQANLIAARRSGWISVNDQIFRIVQEPGRGREELKPRDINLIVNGSFESGIAPWGYAGVRNELGDGALDGSFAVALKEVRKIEQAVLLFPGRYRLEFAHAPGIGLQQSHLDVSLVSIGGEVRGLAERTFVARSFRDTGVPVWQYDSIEFVVEDRGTSAAEKVLVQFARGVKWALSGATGTIGTQAVVSHALLDDVRLLRLDTGPGGSGGIRIRGGTEPAIEVSWPAPGDLQLIVSSDLEDWVPWLEPMGSLVPKQFSLPLAEDFLAPAGFYAFRFVPVHAAGLPITDFETGGAPLVWMEPGTFYMGSEDTDPDRDADEDPRTQVTLTKAFAMGAHEVTQSQYQEIMGVNPSRVPENDRHPVTNATWFEASEFCRRLTQRERWAGRLPVGYEYRLPTEAEWNYACRAGASTRFHYGDDVDYDELDAYAWYEGNSGGTTHPVGTKLPNAWGFYGMHGNVHEWCFDKYGGLPGGHLVDPEGPDPFLRDESLHVIKGGSWGDAAKNCRTEDRHRDWFALTFGNVGFRVALAPIKGTIR